MAVLFAPINAFVRVVELPWGMTFLNIGCLIPYPRVTNLCRKSPRWALNII